MKKLIILLTILVLSACGCAKKQTIIDITDTKDSQERICQDAVDKFIKTSLDKASKDPNVLFADIRFDKDLCRANGISGTFHIYSKTTEIDKNGSEFILCAYVKIEGTLTTTEIPQLLPTKVQVVGAEKCK